MPPSTMKPKKYPGYNCRDCGEPNEILCVTCCVARHKSVKSVSWVPGTTWARCPLCKGYQLTDHSCCNYAEQYAKTGADPYTDPDGARKHMGDTPHFANIRGLRKDDENG